MKTIKPNETVLDGVDEERREFVKKLVAGTAFAAPLLASFSMDGGLIGEAQAAGPQAPYFCDWTTVENGVFRAAFKFNDDVRGSNLARVSAIVKGDPFECSNATINLQFSSKEFSFVRAVIRFSTGWEVPIENEGQTFISDNVAGATMESFFSSLNWDDPHIWVTVSSDSGVEVDAFHGALVGSGY